jgi:hypothetical protein
MKCFQRNGNEPIPGVDVTNIKSGWDACHWPCATVAAVDKGWSGCTPSKQCQVGEADCDSDSDCAGSLRCFERSGSESVPGLDVSGLPNGMDPCYQP